MPKNGFPPSKKWSSFSSGQREHGNDFEAIEAELSQMLFGSTEETNGSEQEHDGDTDEDDDSNNNKDDKDDNGMVTINAKARIPIRKRCVVSNPMQFDRLTLQ